ncbi:MAG: hypothetical protein P8010_17320 [Desulfosarcinaceae bacterium]|jgi:hypothetical protein
MTILKRQAFWTLVTLLLLGGAGHFFLNAYRNHQTQQARLERVRFRQEFVSRQMAELQHKIKVIEQVNAFAGGAEDLGLVPANWTRYEVDIEAPLRFPALADILRQCTSTAFYYFQPNHLKVHLAGQPATDSKDPGDGTLSAEAPAEGESVGAEAGDLFLKLKGSFLARRR